MIIDDSIFIASSAYGDLRVCFPVLLIAIRLPTHRVVNGSGGSLWVSICELGVEEMGSKNELRVKGWTVKQSEEERPLSNLQVTACQRSEYPCFSQLAIKMP
jgi:hypothetical protein